MKQTHVGQIMTPLRASVLAAACLLAPAASQAQALIDQVPRGRTVTTEERIEAEMQSARLLVGPFRVIPVIVVDNAGYDSNVFSRPSGQPKVGDWTASAGAGGRVLFPMGSKFFLRLVAVPQYIWYDQLVDRRTWGGDFSGSFLALGNRLSFEATGGWGKGSTILSSETQATVVETTTNGGAKLEVQLARALSLVGAAEISEDRYSPTGQDPVDPVEVQRFDRTDTAALAGLRLRLTSDLDMTAGVQGTRAEFVEFSQLRDNETYALLGAIHLDRPRFFVNLAGGYRKARPFNGSLFPHYSTWIGSYFASWHLGGPLAVQAYGHRRPVYSFSLANQFYIESRYGGGLSVRLGSRVALSGHVDAGTNLYPYRIIQAGTSLSDDAFEYGGGLSVLLLGNTVVHARAYETDLKPSSGAPERKVFRFITGLSFNGELTRE